MLKGSFHHTQELPVRTEDARTKMVFKLVATKAEIQDHAAPTLSGLQGRYSFFAHDGLSWLLKNDPIRTSKATIVTANCLNCKMSNVWAMRARTQRLFGESLNACS